MEVCTFRKVRDWCVVCLFVCLAGIFPVTKTVAETRVPYSLGILPFLPAFNLEYAYGAAAVEFGKVLKGRVVFRTTHTFDEFRNALKNEDYDIVLVHPFDYVQVAAEHGYLPLARFSEPLTAVMVVLEDFEGVFSETLTDAKIGWLPQTAAVSQLMTRYLEKQGFDIDKVNSRYYRNHTECLQAVLNQVVVACVTAPIPLKLFQKNSDLMLRIIARTDSIPHALFAAHSRLIPFERALLKQNILSWGETVSTRELLMAMGEDRKFVETTDQDYDALRSINQ